jgi:hypothetical protein
MESLERILIEYCTDTDQCLYLLVTRSGELHRRGSPSPASTERHLLIAQDFAKELFSQITQRVDPEWLNRGGRYQIAPDPKQPVRVIRFGFQRLDGSEVILEFVSPITAPAFAPPDLVAFMQYLVDLTQPSYDRVLIAKQ